MWHFILLLSISSCSILFGNRGEPISAKDSSYSIHFSKHGWEYIKDQRSDYVFENLEDGRILVANSFCEEFQDQPLMQLAQKTFKTVKDFKVSKSDYLTFQNREAYELEGQGQVDGVTVRLRLLNTRRGNCYFDFVAIMPEATPISDGSFEEFLKTVVFR